MRAAHDLVDQGSASRAAALGAPRRTSYAPIKAGSSAVQSCQVALSSTAGRSALAQVVGGLLQEASTEIQEMLSSPSKASGTGDADLRGTQEHGLDETRKAGEGDVPQLLRTLVGVSTACAILDEAEAGRSASSDAGGLQTQQQQGQGQQQQQQGQGQRQHSTAKPALPQGLAATLAPWLAGTTTAACLAQEVLLELRHSVAPDLAGHIGAGGSVVLAQVRPSVYSEETTYHGIQENSPVAVWLGVPAVL